MTVDQIKSLLALKSHPTEGGYFAEAYRSERIVSTEGGPRSLATAIYYLLTPDTFSAMHRLPGDEIFHFYLGDPVEMLQLFPDGSDRTVILGSDPAGGMTPQAVVPGGVWQGSRLLPAGRFALLGTTMSPGFDFADYEAGDEKALSKSHPRVRDRIVALTRTGGLA